MLNWTSDNVFEIDNTIFTIDISAGPKRRPSENNNFTLVKTKRFLAEYTKLVGNKFPHILELGVFQGGSLVLLDKLFKPERIVGVDIAQDKIAALENYIEKSAPHMKTYFKSSQSDTKLLTKIISQDFQGKLDLVVDDASHLYEHTKKSFAYLYPILQPGGLYIIEDWAWSFTPGAQSDQHPWYKMPALANLIIELLAEIGGNKDIDEIRIMRDMVVIKKSKNLNNRSLFESVPLRGRSLPAI